MTTNNQPMAPIGIEILQGILQMVSHLLTNDQIKVIEGKVANNPASEWGDKAVVKMITIAREAGLTIPAYRVRFSPGGKEYMLHSHEHTVRGFIALLNKYGVKFSTVAPVKDDTKEKWRRRFFPTQEEALAFRAENKGWLGPEKKGDRWVIYQLND